MVPCDSGTRLQLYEGLVGMVFALNSEKEANAKTADAPPKRKVDPGNRLSVAGFNTIYTFGWQ